MSCIQKGVTMEEKDIRKYAELMQELGLTGLEVSENGSVVRLERTTLVKEVPTATATHCNEKEEHHADLINICSPMVGMFYRAPAENAAPFVQVGDTVRKGDVLGIIEAMKLMNEIVAEQNGTVCEVCAGNKQIVDFGHVLFRLKKEQE